MDGVGECVPRGHTDQPRIELDARILLSGLLGPGLVRDLGRGLRPDLICFQHASTQGWNSETWIADL